MHSCILYNKAKCHDLQFYIERGVKPHKIEVNFMHSYTFWPFSAAWVTPFKVTEVEKNKEVE